jgi:hypothetical protein
MSVGLRDVVQLWSAPQCETNAVALGPITTWTSARVTASTDAPPVLTMQGVLSAELQAAGARDGCALKVLSATRGVSWWIVTQITDTAEGDRASLRAGPLRTLLAFRGLVRDGDETTITPPERVTPAELLTTLVLTNLMADRLDWLSLGTVDSDQLLTLGALTRLTRAQVVARLEQETGCTAVLRPLVPDGSTGFALDLLRDPAGSAATRLIAPHVMADTISRTRDVAQSPSRVRPIDSAGRGMGLTVWAVDAINSLWVTLRDPSSAETRWPIRADGQCVGCRLQQADGTLHEITDSRASDGAVELNNTTGLTVGERVRLVADTAGAPVRVVDWPPLLTTRGIVESVQVATTEPLELNLAENPLFSNWTNLFTPEGWAQQGGTYDVAEYPRSTPSTLTGIVVDGAAVIGAGGVNFRNAPAGARFYANEYVVVGANAYRIANVVAEASGTGTGSLVFTTTLVANVADGTAMSFFGQEPKRPLSIPSDGTSNDLVRLLTGGGSATPPSPTAVRFQSPAVQVLYRAANPVLRFAAAFTVHNGTGTDVATGSLPRIMLRNNTANTRLAWAEMTGPVAAGATAHQTVTGSATLTADTTVDLAFPTYGDGGLFAAARWVALWLGPSTTPPVVDGSTANAAWHTANDALAATADAATVRVTGADLNALLADGDPLVVGQRVRLRVPAWGTDATLRIVGLEWSLDAGDRVSLDLGRAPARLSAALVSP